jgi:hypothetical protein
MTMHGGRHKDGRRVGKPPQGLSQLTKSALKPAISQSPAGVRKRQDQGSSEHQLCNSRKSRAKIPRRLLSGARLQKTHNLLSKHQDGCKLHVGGHDETSVGRVTHRDNKRGLAEKVRCNMSTGRDTCSCARQVGMGRNGTGRNGTGIWERQNTSTGCYKTAYGRQTQGRDARQNKILSVDSGRGHRTVGWSGKLGTRTRVCGRQNAGTGCTGQ